MKPITINLFFILYFIIKLSYISSSKLEEVQLAIKEVAFSYYMRGKYIQYSTSKTHYFSPEEATRQNINFLVCTSFLRTLYVELLNFSTPPNPSNLIDYTKKNIDNAEVIIYSHVRNEN